MVEYTAPGAIAFTCTLWSLTSAARFSPKRTTAVLDDA